MQSHVSKTKDQPWKWRESFSQREPADRLGCSQTSISNIVKKPRFTGSVRDLKIPWRKKENYEDRIMVKKASQIALGLHRKTKQKCWLNMVTVSSLPLPDEDWDRLVPTAAYQVTICTTIEQFFLTACIYIGSAELNDFRRTLRM